MQKLVTQLLWRKHIHPLPCYGSVSIWEESQQHTWKERKCCLPTPPQSYQTPNTDIGFDWNFSASVKCMHILKRWVLVLPIHRIKINYVYLTQQIAAEGCAISSKTWRIWGWSERLDVPVFHQAVRALPDDKTILLPKWNWPKKMKNWREGKKKKKTGKTRRHTEGLRRRASEVWTKLSSAQKGDSDRHSLKWRHSPGVTALTDSLAFRCSREGRGTNG